MIASLPDPVALGADARLVVSDRHWHFVEGLQEDARQGWKLYASFAAQNGDRTLRQIVPILLKRSIRFKYIRSQSELMRLNAGLLGYSQIGKCLVCYLSGEHRTLVSELLEALAKLHDNCGPVIPFARRLSPRLPLYYRFGSFIDGDLLIDGCRVKDDRYVYPLVIPDDVPDWLGDFVEPEPATSRTHPFLLRYPVFRALRQHGKSGVFAALDFGAPEFREVVVKMGYRAGALQPDGSDGRTFVRREIASYRRLREVGLHETAPTMIDAFEDEEHAILVLEMVKGEDGLTLLRRRDIRQYDLEQAWRILCQLNAAGIYVGDAKIANFLRRTDGRMFIIDLESAVCADHNLTPLRTFDVTASGIGATPAEQDKLHFLGSVAFDYGVAEYLDELLRPVDLAQCSLDHLDPDVAHWFTNRRRDVTGV